MDQLCLYIIQRKYYLNLYTQYDSKFIIIDLYLNAILMFCFKDSQY